MDLAFHPMEDTTKGCRCTAIARDGLSSGEDFLPYQAVSPTRLHCLEREVVGKELKRIENHMNSSI